MAFVGLKYCVFAPITTETPFTPIVYDTGVVLGRMIGANITFNRNSEPMYADDGMAESDNSITGGTISLNLDDVEEAAQVTAFGLLKTGDPGSEVYSEVGDPAPYGGIGYVRVRRLRGVTSYVAYWLHKVQLAVNTDNAFQSTRPSRGETANSDKVLPAEIIHIAQLISLQIRK